MVKSDGFKFPSFGGQSTPMSGGMSNYDLLYLGAREKNEELISKWILNKMEEFGKIMRMSCEGFESEIRELFYKIERGNGGKMGMLAGGSGDGKRLRSELRKSQCGMRRDWEGPV